MQGDDNSETEDNSNQQLISWGCGEFGQHCHGTKNDISFRDGLLPRFSAGEAKFIACGSSHTLLVTHNNEIFSWGNGNSGQVGTGVTDLQWEPVRVHLYDNTTEVVPQVAGVACGGRHSMVWLANGNVFSFGNNFYAQLGYDYRAQNYKENQVKPQLLKFLVYKPVIQVSCGEKHTLFLFKGGSLACVGCNSNGQIGSGRNEDATIPVTVELDQPVKSITSGANHNLVITDKEEVYMWGYGKGCGRRTADVLSPEKVPLPKKNVVQVVAGSLHSLALTASGSVYVWGTGSDGQLGLGNQVSFLCDPKRLNNCNLKHNVIQIAACETYSTAVTENGDLYYWGRNSHIFQTSNRSTSRVWVPFCINKGLRYIKSVVCGSWHAVAVSGSPVHLLHSDNDSVLSDPDFLMASPVNGVHDMDDTSDESEGDFAELPQITLKKDYTCHNKESTKLSIGDFYEGGDIDFEGKTPSPAIFQEESSHLSVEEILADKPESAKSKIVVQVPRPTTTVVDVATSPIPFSDSENESEHGASQHSLAKTSSAKTNKQPVFNKYLAQNDQQKVITSATSTVPQQRMDKPHSKPSVHTKYYNTMMERDKSFVSKHPPSVVQLSKSTADHFSLPRENTSFSSRQIDLTDVEYARAISSTKANEKLYWINKLNESREREILGRIHNANSHWRSSTQESQFSRDSTIAHSLRSGRVSEAAVINLQSYDSVMDGSPTKWNRKIESSLADYGKHFGNGEILEEARRAARLPPKLQPTRSIPKKSSDANFALQITRSDTVIAPIKTPKKIMNPRLLNPMERYASVHNPASNSNKFTEKKAKLGLKTPRNVSIPGSREATMNELSDFCIKGETGKKAIYSSATSWKNKNDLQRVKNIQKESQKVFRSDSTSTHLEEIDKENNVTEANDIENSNGFIGINGEQIETENISENIMEDSLARETMSDYGGKSFTQSN